MSPAECNLRGELTMSGFPVHSVEREGLPTAPTGGREGCLDRGLSGTAMQVPNFAADV